MRTSCWIYVFCAAVSLTMSLGAQDFGDPSALRINEVLSANRSTPPPDVENEFEDMVEIYNPTDELILLKDLVLAAEVVKDLYGNLHPAWVGGACWKLPCGAILPKSFIMIFCDGSTETSSVKEPHSSFQLNQGGGLVALFTPQDELIDLVVFPRMPLGRSYGRFPDGGYVWGYPEQPTFVKCPVTNGGCTTAGNTPFAGVAPEVDLRPFGDLPFSYGEAPAADAPVTIAAEAWDEQEDEVAGMKVLYRVNGGPEEEAAMIFDPDETSKLVRQDPFDRTASIPDRCRSIWKGQISGQPAGSVVTFILEAADDDALRGFDPPTVCTGPPGPEASECQQPYRYLVGYRYRGPVVINEICPCNASIFRDATDFVFDDYIEITSGEDADLSGMWLSLNPFRPQEWVWGFPEGPSLCWQFPAGSTIRKGEHLLVWCDGDERTNPEKGEYHVNFTLGEIDIEDEEDLVPFGEGVFLFDAEANGLGLIDGFVFGVAGGTTPDLVWSRCPDGARGTSFLPVLGGTPMMDNGCEERFVRGDTERTGEIDLSDAIGILSYLFAGGASPSCIKAADADDTGSVDIADPVFILGFLFGGGPSIPAPFPDPGFDPTLDDLPCQGI
jgi:hypothetical protein